MGRREVIPSNGFVSEALSFTSLLLTKGGRNRSIKGTVDVINALSNTFIKKMLIGI